MAEIPFPAWNPVILDLGFIQLRWYSLMYIVGFIVGARILGGLRRSGFLPMPEQRIGDLVFWLILGVLLGGRIGYVVFYYLVHGRFDYLSNPIRLIAVWEGGLSFHGGLLGVVVVTLWFCRRNGFPALRVGDCLALGVTPGIFAVRVANFINGELYGRTTDASVPWAMRFPTDETAQRLLGIPATLSLRERERAILDKVASSDWARVKEQVPLRHPSQLYEALAEGLLLGLLLLWVYRATRHRPLGPGVLFGIMLAGYGVGRFVVEYFREPDDHLGLIFVELTMGQILCLAMIVAGALFIGVQWRKRPPPAATPAPEEAVAGG